MKFDIVKTVIAIIVSALAAYIISVADCTEYGAFVPVMVGIESLITLISALGLKVSWLRTMANIKITSWIFFIVFLAVNLIFAKKCASVQTFIITNGIILVIFILLGYSLLKANKE